MKYSNWGRWLNRVFGRPARTGLNSKSPSSPRGGARGAPGPGAGLLDRRGPGGNFWSVANNWSLGRSPITGDDVVFGNQATVGGNRNVTDDLPIAPLPVFNSITISATGYTLNGTQNTTEVAISGNFTVTSGVASATIAKSLALFLDTPSGNGNQTIAVGLSSNLDIVGNVISGNSQQTATMVGPGKLQLDADNSKSFFGEWSLTQGAANNGGFLIITTPNALGLVAVRRRMFSIPARLSPAPPTSPAAHSSKSMASWARSTKT